MTKPTNPSDVVRLATTKGTLKWEEFNPLRDPSSPILEQIQVFMSLVAKMMLIDVSGSSLSSVGVDN